MGKPTPLTGLLNLMLPPKCPFCRKILNDPAAPLCPSCQPALPWLQGAQQARAVDFTDACLSPLRYQGVVREAVHRYKFTPTPALAPKLAMLMAQCVQAQSALSAHALTWAPLSRRRRRSRGFDQAQLLAQEMGRLLDLPVYPTLKKARHTLPQSGLEGDAARRANALGAYEPLPGIDLSGKGILLVDDVVTSGATLSECARQLRQAGAARIWCVTLAQAGSGAQTDEKYRKNS
jgi:ComF family protein